MQEKILGDIRDRAAPLRRNLMLRHLLDSAQGPASKPKDALLNMFNNSQNCKGC